VTAQGAPASGREGLRLRQRPLSDAVAVLQGLAEGGLWLEVSGSQSALGSDAWNPDRCDANQSQSGADVRVSGLTRASETPASLQCTAGVGCHTDRMALSVLIVDDSEVFLREAPILLEREGVSTVGVASTMAQAHRRVEQLSPDVVLVDIRLAGESGFELARRLLEHDHCGAAVILISTHSREDFADLIAESPAAGFLAKSELSGQAIRGILGAEG